MSSYFLATRQIVVLRLVVSITKRYRLSCTTDTQIAEWTQFCANLTQRAAEQKSCLYTEMHTDTATSPVEPPCISPLVLFPEEQAERFVRSAQGFSEKADFGLGFVYLGYRFGTGCRLVRP